ncbi:MAG: DUF2065 domain-containing protein [Nitrospinae bacterium]|nr:DUF2065 domain-containing protein [Nitrospinota bacterium]
MRLFLSALGLMMIFEGIPYFGFPSRVKEFARRIPEIPDRALRAIGLAVMLLGLLVIYLGRKIADHG